MTLLVGNNAVGAAATTNSPGFPYCAVGSSGDGVAAVATGTGTHIVVYDSNTGSADRWVVALYSTTGTLLEQSAGWAYVSAGAGWKSIALNNPVSITTGTKYIIAVSTGYDGYGKVTYESYGDTIYIPGSQTISGGVYNTPNAFGSTPKTPGGFGSLLSAYVDGTLGGSSVAPLAMSAYSRMRNG